MQIIRRRADMTAKVCDLRESDKKIGFVPTMGFLHAGHLSLVTRARRENDAVIVSIFVNPTQFAPNEDFAGYPRDLERDARVLERNTDYLFAPDDGEMYGKDEKILFKVDDIAGYLCGVSRPKHFAGVVQVVAKLLNIVRPNRVYFGQKDYQQTVVIRQLLEELFFDAELVVCPTVREKDGLAMSSRNIRLSKSERAQAPVLYRSLNLALDLMREGEKNPDVIIQKIKDVIAAGSSARIDYVDVRDSENLSKIQMIGGRKVVIALAACVGETRLIDNVLYDPAGNAA